MLLPTEGIRSGVTVSLLTGSEAEATDVARYNTAMSERVNFILQVYSEKQF